jgi:hypothetical protein
MSAHLVIGCYREIDFSGEIRRDQWLGDNPFIDQGSGEAERGFRREAELHSEMNPNTLGAWLRWPFDFASSASSRKKLSEAQRSG